MYVFFVFFLNEEHFVKSNKKKNSNFVYFSILSCNL